MKVIKFIGILAAASFLSFSAFAQEDNNVGPNGEIVRGPYVTNGVFDNTFIAIGAGVNSAIEKQFGMGKIGLATDLNIGKWFSPAIGIRAGWHGLFDTAKSGKIEKAPFNYFHGDLLWNISNSIAGYKETRFWSFIPYATTGLLIVGQNNGKFSLKGNQEFASGVGLLNQLRLGERVNLNIDLRPR